MIKELNKKEFVSILKENDFTSKEIQKAWINAKHRRGIA